MTGATYTLQAFFALSGVTATWRGVVNAGYVTTLAWDWDGSSQTYYLQSRYFTASPPYDLGDGEIPLFVFVQVDSGGNVLGADVAQDPPWAYNGPTDIRPDRKTKDGRKFRRVPRLIAEFGNSVAARAALPREVFIERLATDPVVEQEITQALKNADMPLIPHPWPRIPPGRTVVMLDGQSPLMARLLAMHGAAPQGETISDLLREGYLQIDNVALARRAPPGVMPASVKWRVTS